MFELLYFLTFACMQPVVTNNTEQWNEVDVANLRVTRTHCLNYFPNSAPCLKAFHKKATNRYIYTCKPGVIKWKTYSYMFMKRRKYHEGFKTKRYIH